MTLTVEAAVDADAALNARRELAACYRHFAQRQMDDSIYAHLSARVPGTRDRFLFIPFGMLFDEVTVSRLIEVDIAGRNLTDDRPVNPAGWIVHRIIYDAIGSAGSVMHLHTIAGTAVSVQQGGLLPINQFAMTYHDRIAYHAYDGPNFRPEEQRRLIEALGGRPILFLRNHGTLTHGKTVAEAFTLIHNVERSCIIQIAAQSGGGALTLPPQEVLARTAAINQGVGDRGFGEVGFRAMMRQLDRSDGSYRD